MHPFQPRLSAVRRWGMPAVFILLVILIGAYWYYTDSMRVRKLAETYLTRLLGGPVRVEGATLSIFEGLRLDGVEVLVDDQRSIDSVIFTAKSFQLQYNPAAMLRGELVATQIRAIDPHVHLTENRDTGRWNYQRMIRQRASPRTEPVEPSKPLVLPEILLRNAQIEYSEIRSGQLYRLGSMAIEGRLTPDVEPGQYAFDLQSRGQNEGVGPVISGSIVMDTGFVSARMFKFRFGRDIRTMLPAQVRDWWEAHGLAGRVNIPELTYMPPRNGSPAKFKVVTDLDGVTFAMQPEEFRSQQENDRMAAAAMMFTALRCGHDGRSPQNVPDPPKPLSAHAMASVSDGFERWDNTFDAAPIRLHSVSGSFVFTESGIAIEQVSGRVETNAIRLSGKIDGYSPLAPVELTIQSGLDEHIYLPAGLSYANSLPLPVREMYERLRPEGTCDLKFELRREQRGGKVSVDGGVNILDGNFVFDRFPYRLRRATGRVEIGRDQDSGLEYLAIKDLKGLGIEGGPNAQAVVSVNGLIAPLGPEAGVTIRVEGKGIHSEPAMTDAFPRDFKRTLTFLDAERKGGPTFVGNFVCDILRPIGLKQSWTINTDVELLDATGSLTMFPYPLRQVKGLLKIREGHVDIVNTTSRTGDATLAIDGRITWRTEDEIAAGLIGTPADPGPKVRPDIRIVARHIPIDKQLLDALPQARREWLEKLGLGGTLDIDGKLGAAGAPGLPPVGPDDEVTFDLTLALHDGSIWPADGTFAISGLAGALRLTPSSLEIIRLDGKRDTSAISAQGLIDWSDGKPTFKLSTTAKALALDAPLYQVLPADAKSAWDSVHPSGTADIALDYEEGSTSTKPSIKLVVVPQKLSIKPNVFAYRMDDLQGVIRYDNDRVSLEKLTARHGDTTVAVAGAGTLGAAGAWDLTVSAGQLVLDDELRSALPSGLAEMLTSAEFKGVCDLEFSKLRYWPSSKSARVTPTTDPSGTPTDLDFACKLSMRDASLDAGVPLQHITGSLSLNGKVRASELDALDGQISIDAMTIADRPTREFVADLRKESGEPILRLQNMQAQMAGGEMAGAVEWSVGEKSASRYAVNLLLRNADVRELAGESGTDVEGRVNASLALAGNWNAPDSRRGRGDVVATGRQMYRIPLILGLLQITNLALPINKPFSEASSRYSVDGQRIIFEEIRLRAENMQMQGSGTLDFKTKRVNLTFFTDSSNWAKIPIVGDLLKGAREELLQFHVKGTLEEPKVSATSMHTFQTTVDEVFREPK